MSAIGKSPAIFITGAAAGIGAATAKRFAAGGWRVGLADRDEAGLQAVAKGIGSDRCSSYTVDVTDFASLTTALESFTESTGGRLDLMFSNAGILCSDDFESLPLADYARMVEVNFMGVINCAHAAFPWLKATPGARLVNTSSASAIAGAPGFAVYSASKFGVRGLTEALNVEWARHDIAVCDVMPMFVQTAMVAQVGKREAMDRMGVRLGPDDVAAAVWRAAHWPRWWPRAHYFVGLQSLVLALSARVLPAWLNRWTTRLLTGY